MMVKGHFDYNIIVCSFLGMFTVLVCSESVVDPRFNSSLFSSFFRIPSR